MEEMDEEHGGEDGLLAEAKNDKGKLTKASVKARLAEIKHDKDAADERKLLDAYVALIEQEAAASKQVKDAQKALDAKVSAQYSRTQPRPRSRRWWWTTNGWPPWPPACRANWIA